MARLIKAMILVLLSAATFAVSMSASAHGRYHRHGGARIGVGVVFGAPLWYPAPVYYPYYRPYYSAPAPAPVYIERDRDVAESSPYWYYCRESDAYYPYVKQCPGPWQHVPAQPAQ